MQRPERAPTGLRGEAGSGFRRAAVLGGVLVLAVSVTATTLAMSRPPGQPRLTVAGVAEDPCQPQRALPVPAGLNGQFEPDSSVLRTAGGTYLAAGRSAPPTRNQSACSAAAEQADRAWLRAGTIPGDIAAWRSMATRALLDLRLDVRPDGAVVAGGARLGLRLAARLELGRGGAGPDGSPGDGLSDPPLPAAHAAGQRDLGGQVPAGRLGSGARRPACPAGRRRLGSVGGLVLGRHPTADTGRRTAPRARAAVADGRPVR